MSSLLILPGIVITRSGFISGVIGGSLRLKIANDKTKFFISFEFQIFIRLQRTSSVT